MLYSRKDCSCARSPAASWCRWRRTYVCCSIWRVTESFARHGYGNGNAQLYLAVQHVRTEVAHVDRIGRARYYVHQRKPCFCPLKEVGQLQHVSDRTINRAYIGLKQMLFSFEFVLG